MGTKVVRRQANSDHGAMQRSLGAKDCGTMISGHGGVMDRMDSVILAAPVFFHLTRHFFER